MMSSSTPRADAAASVELRASVLDAAINLGFRNSVMAKWMFDPTVEMDEMAEQANPGLMSPSSSTSTTSHSTSEESSMSPFNFRLLSHLPGQNPKLEMIDEQVSIRERESENIILSRPVTENTPVDSSKPVEPVGDTDTSDSPGKDKRKKLRKLKNGYESDGGYISEGEKKAKKSLMWRKKQAIDDYESDGGHLGEGVSIKKSKKKGKKNKDEEFALPQTDPERFLATVNESLSLSASLPDGYLTDSAASTKRGRTKKVKKKTTAARASSPSGAEDDSPNLPSKKKSLFQMMTRSSSRDKDRERRPEPHFVPPPVPPLPASLSKSLPIAERFARAGTPLGSLELTPDTSSPSGSNPLALSTTSSAADISSMANISLNSPNSLLVPQSDTSRSVSPLNLSGVYNGKVAQNPHLRKNGGLFQSSGAKSMEIPRDEAGHPISRTQRERSGSEKALHQSNLRSRSTSPTDLKTFDLGRVTSRMRHPFASPGGASSSAEVSPPKLSISSISAPNPHFVEDRPTRSPLEIAAAINSRATSPTLTSPSNLMGSRVASPSTRTPDSYVFVEPEERSVTPVSQWASEDNQNRTSAYNIVPSSAFILPSPSTTPSPIPSGLPQSSLATRRAANVRALAPPKTLDVTPTQSRTGTPSQEEFLARRASVLAYYQLPPPSPPPTGPLPSVPNMPPPEGDLPRRPSEDRQFLTPGRALGPRSRSPLRSMSPNVGLAPGVYSPSRSTSPGLLGQPIPSVRRGKESPFPVRPILPPQDSRDLVERVERYKMMYGSSEDGAEGFREDDDFENEADVDADVDVMSSLEELVDTRSSTYIRAARARGEKRVYFTTPADTPTNEPEIVIEMDGDDGEERSRYTENQAGDRRSVASMSVYSRYSIIDADKSAQLRDGFVRRVEALYNTDNQEMGGARWDDIPDVPELPAALRDAAPGFSKGNLKTKGLF